MNITGGGVTAGHTLSADGGFGTISIRNGDLLGDIISGRDIKSLSIRGSDIGDALNPVTISAAAGIGRIQTDGTLENSTIRSGANIDNLSVGNILDSIVSAGWKIGTLLVRNNVNGSHILAGYDV